MMVTTIQSCRDLRVDKASRGQGEGRGLAGYRVD